MSQQLNNLGTVELGEVAIICGAITTANLFPSEFPTAEPALGQPVTTYKEGGNVYVKIGDEIAAQFTPNERAEGDTEPTYSATGNSQVKEILLDMGLVEDLAEGPTDEVIVEDPAPAA